MNDSFTVFKTPAPLSYRIFYLLIVVLAGLSALNVFLPQGWVTGDVPAGLPASDTIIALVNAVIVLILYGGLGYVGMKLSEKLDFAPLWNDQISLSRRLITPALWGIGLGVAFIFIDLWLGKYHQFGPLPHPPFPTSLVASASAAIGEEVIFRLFFITLIVWALRKALPADRWANVVFWSAAVLSGIIFAAGHLPSVMILLGLRDIAALPVVLIIELLVLNGSFSLVAAYFLKEVGLLGAVMTHFWLDVVWHVIWGVF